MKLPGGGGVGVGAGGGSSAAAGPGPGAVAGPARDQGPPALVRGSKVLGRSIVSGGAVGGSDNRLELLLLLLLPLELDPELEPPSASPRPGPRPRPLPGGPTPATPAPPGGPSPADCSSPPPPPPWGGTNARSSSASVSGCLSRRAPAPIHQPPLRRRWCLRGGDGVEPLDEEDVDKRGEPADEEERGDRGWGVGSSGSKKNVPGSGERDRNRAAARVAAAARRRLGDGDMAATRPRASQRGRRRGQMAPKEGGDFKAHGCAQSPPTLLGHPPASRP